jgi:hypothetical protein
MGKNKFIRVFVEPGELSQCCDYTTDWTYEKSWFDSHQALEISRLHSIQSHLASYSVDTVGLFVEGVKFPSG